MNRSGEVAPSDAPTDASPAPRLVAGAGHSAGLRRDIEVLRELASEESLRRGGLGVVRIAERLRREKSQVSRALRALAAEGLVERDPLNRTYQLGWGLYTLAARGVETRLVRAATTYLHRLAEQHHSRARLCVLIGGQVLSLLSVPPGTTARVDAPADPEAVPITTTPAGPALVLDWPDIAVRDLLMPSESDYQFVREHIEQARHRRYVSYTDPDGQPSFAAPVRDFRGIVLGAVELTWAGLPVVATNGESGAVSASLVQATAQLSDELGFDQRPRH